MLVFLPGKAEIEACARALRDEPYKLLPLHGGLSLAEQRRVFEPASRRKADPRHQCGGDFAHHPWRGRGDRRGPGAADALPGRPRLAVRWLPVAADSAAQRTGRAGRTAAGVCLSAVATDAKLEKSTLPEVHSASLVAAAARGRRLGRPAEQLPFLDPPKSYALAAARVDLAAWGALGRGWLAERERSRAVHAARRAPARAAAPERQRARCLEDIADLVAVLSVKPSVARAGRTRGARPRPTGAVL
jgi:ATP-dependent helicase HrpB